LKTSAAWTNRFFSFSFSFPTGRFIYFVVITYSLRSAKAIYLAFKFCSINTICLDSSKIHPTKEKMGIKKELRREGYKANQIFTFLVSMHLHLLRSSNAFVFIEDL